MTATYDIPDVLATAINTDRGELCELFACQLDSNNPLAATLSRIIGDLLNDRRETQNILIALEESCEQTGKQFDAFAHKVAAAQAHIRGESQLERTNT